MNARDDPVRKMLRVALGTIQQHHSFYLRAANAAMTPQVKALLLVLAESEEELTEKINDMLLKGIVEELSSVVQVGGVQATPDSTPFAPERHDTDPRIFVCNKALEQEVRAYSFFLSIAAHAKSEVVSHLFEYFAQVKAEQIRRIRRVCESF